jgi:transposase
VNEQDSTTHKRQRRYVRRRGRKLPKRLELLNPDAAGIDIGAHTHFVSVPEDRDEEPVREFGCYTPSLQEMAQWLKQCGIKSVVLESTGVYWMPVFRVLESHGIEVVLVNPRHVKYVPGRKTDVADCQWLRQLHTFGLLRGAFVPPDHVAAMRTYWRQRKDLVEAASREVLHIQKALTQMNVHLHVVLSDITGVSGMKILRAIVAGQHEPLELAALANAQVKSSRDEIVQALSGHYTPHHLFTLRQALELFDVFQSKIQDCDQQLAQYLRQFESKADPKSLGPHPKKSKRGARRKNEPYFDLRSEIYRLTGVDFSRIDGIDSMVAFTVLSEIGFDVNAFPSEEQFASWLGLCPNNTITGGNVKKRHTRHVVNRAADALRVAAQSLWRSKSYLGAYHRRFVSRLGPPKGITATAHKLACIFYRALKYGQPYVDQGEHHLEQQHRERSLRSLIVHAKELGYTLVHSETGECPCIANKGLTKCVS